MYPVILLTLYLPDMTGSERDVSSKDFAVRNSSMQKRPFPGGVEWARRAQQEIRHIPEQGHGRRSSVKGCNVCDQGGGEWEDHGVRIGCRGQ